MLKHVLEKTPLDDGLVASEKPFSWTVLASFEPKPRTDTAYQSEAELEATFIQALKDLGYEFLKVHNEDGLKANLRKQMERLNTHKEDGPEGFHFTDSEWEKFYSEVLANKREGVVEKTERFQQNPEWALKRKGKLFRNLKLVDKKYINENILQVLHQYEEEHEGRKSRYDVTILLNGLPVVHIELKRRGKGGEDSLHEAFNQIKRYQDTSFWSGDGLFNWVQLFVISNGTRTRYYSNTLRLGKIKYDQASPTRTRKSFEFTFHWADQKNHPIHDLEDFTQTFFNRNTLLNLLLRYCVFDTTQDLKILRPYQIAACEKILQRICMATSCKTIGTKKAGGYIWHTTGSGKTLTSFKTAQLAKDLPSIDKVLFVVDRKDLDAQTVAEYNKFKKNCVAGSVSTDVLNQHLEDKSTKIVVTTIQKLGLLIKRYKTHSAYSKRVVFIFDECHRSQFGELHRGILDRFKDHICFGFTGTPIFKENAFKGMITTEQVFGSCLHTYTIVDAIRDQSVLKFLFQQYQTFAPKEAIKDKRVRAINREEAYQAPERIKNVVQKILEVFEDKTKRDKTYTVSNSNGKQEKARGFNALFAVDSITSARLYYKEFKNQLQTAKSSLKLATIFTYPANEDPDQDNGSEFQAERMEPSAREALETAIQDYNRTFNTQYAISDCDGYRTDLARRIKNGEVDLTLVVNIFLTGFDAPRLNTLFVDRPLVYHGLIQAFSRTNRILNEHKQAGNIVCFRDLNNDLSNALRLFGNADTERFVLMRSFKDYYEGYEDETGHHLGYQEIIQKLRAFSPKQDIVGEQKQKEFIELFNTFLKTHSFLITFDEFTEEKRLTEGERQDYTSLYITLYQQFQQERKENAESIKEDVLFSMELVQEFAVDIDYILALNDQQRASKNEPEFTDHINRMIDSTPFLRNKKDLILEFIKLKKSSQKWPSFVREQKEKALSTIIREARLDPEKTKAFVENAFEREEDLSREGSGFINCLPADLQSLKDRGNFARQDAIWKRLKEFFDKFFGLIKTALK
ncbi:MAG: type I restriction endonuclease subunit R [Opitutales bacterium]|nr:type I restriction endonuclease subunit R [Opitutales bacterium]